MLNQATLVGRITKDLSVKYTQEGRAVINFILAVPRNYRDQNGIYKADFVNCTIWGRIAEATAEYCKKGSMVGVIGKIATRKYEDTNTRTVFVTEVIVDQVQFMKTGQKKDIENEKAGIINEKESFLFGNNDHPNQILENSIS